MSWLEASVATSMIRVIKTRKLKTIMMIFLNGKREMCTNRCLYSFISSFKK